LPASLEAGLAVPCCAEGLLRWHSKAQQGTASPFRAASLAAAKQLLPAKQGIKHIKDIP